MIPQSLYRRDPYLSEHDTAVLCIKYPIPRRFTCFKSNQSSLSSLANLTPEGFIAIKYMMHNACASCFSQ